ncbi:MAG: hypothetical protein AAB510_02130 [Patescibacteria group bacterium]
MITKQTFIKSVLREVDIIKHLAEKITPEVLVYKPTESQRTTLELLGYLAVGPGIALQVAKAGDQSLFAVSGEKQKEVTLENFREIIDKEAAEIKSTMEAMTDEELNEEIDLWGSGMKEPRSQHILTLVLLSFVAYKMQLFLYLKSSGLVHLNTQNVWQGRDPEPKN